MLPTYRLTTPGQPDELLQANSARREGIYTVLRGTAYVMGRPREIVVRRVSADVIVEVALVDEALTEQLLLVHQGGRGRGRRVVRLWTHL